MLGLCLSFVYRRGVPAQFSQLHSEVIGRQELERTITLGTQFGIRSITRSPSGLSPISLRTRRKPVPTECFLDLPVRRGAILRRSSLSDPALVRPSFVAGGLKVEQRTNEPRISQKRIRPALILVNVQKSVKWSSIGLHPSKGHACRSLHAVLPKRMDGRQREIDSATGQSRTQPSGHSQSACFKGRPAPEPPGCR